MDIDWSIRRIAVTGAAAGIGRALAEDLATRGAQVALIDCAPTLEQATATISDYGGKAVAVSADLVTVDAAETAIAQAWDALGGLDGLANVAGLYPVSPALELGEAEWDQVTTVNLKSAFFCARALASRLIDADRPGGIVNISSTASVLARPGVAHYAASKAGLNQLTRVLALEWARHGIRVNAVLPGVIETERVRAHAASPTGRAESAAKLAHIPLGRFGNPAEVVDACIFLLGSASYCTGTLLTVDGGYTLGLPAYES